MREHSETAWKIASLYSHVLASETRDLAAHIDEAVAAERERCAKIADDYAKRAWAANPSAQEAGVAAEHIARNIRSTDA